MQLAKAKISISAVKRLRPGLGYIEQREELELGGQLGF